MPTPRTTKTRLTTSCPGSVADALTTEEEAAWANGGVAARVRREASCATRVRRRGGLPDAVPGGWHSELLRTSPGVRGDRLR